VEPSEHARDELVRRWMLSRSGQASQAIEHPAQGVEKLSTLGALGDVPIEPGPCAGRKVAVHVCGQMARRPAMVPGEADSIDHLRLDPGTFGEGSHVFARRRDPFPKA
jgi:hypothetical protein